jgi:hypothetical protein
MNWGPTLPLYLCPSAASIPPVTANGKANDGHRAGSGRSEHQSFLSVLYCPFSDGTGGEFYSNPLKP